MAARKKTMELVGISKEAFDKLWNGTVFETVGKRNIIREVFRELYTQERLDPGALWIIGQAFHFGAVKRHPFEMPETPVKDARTVAAAARTITSSSISSFLRPYTDVLACAADPLARLANQIPTNSELVVQITRPFLESNDPQYFLPALTLLDAYSPTKTRNRTESFFACVLSSWFRRKDGHPRWKLVVKIVTMCFDAGDDKRRSVKGIEENCRKFRRKFKRWGEAAEAIFLTAKRVRITSLLA